MANDNGHGGYRRPANPAPVSGPSKFSQRTDGGPTHMQITGGSYGSSQEFQQQQSAAPLAPQPGSAGGTAAPQPLDMSSVTGLGAPSSMPHVPVTDGAAAGPGGGPEVLGKPVDPMSEEAQHLGKYLPVMIEVADSDTASPAFRKYVRQLIQNL